jgi:hypothetical protein
VVAVGVGTTVEAGVGAFVGVGVAVVDTVVEGTWVVAVLVVPHAAATRSKAASTLTFPTGGNRSVLTAVLELRASVYHIGGRASRAVSRKMHSVRYCYPSRCR